MVKNFHQRVSIFEISKNLILEFQQKDINFAGCPPPF